jgi:hypothetical protein
VTVKAWLEGHQCDLQDLAELLSSGDVRVVREDDSYYLTSPKIDNPPQGATFYEALRRPACHKHATSPETGCLLGVSCGYQ